MMDARPSQRGRVWALIAHPITSFVALVSVVACVVGVVGNGRSGVRRWVSGTDATALATWTSTPIYAIQQGSTWRFVSEEESWDELARAITERSSQVAKLTVHERLAQDGFWARTSEVYECRLQV